jgi:hypothetical protein
VPGEPARAVLPEVEADGQPEGLTKPWK